jgi:hypothetical protein
VGADLPVEARQDIARTPVGHARALDREWLLHLNGGKPAGHLLKIGLDEGRDAVVEAVADCARIVLRTADDRSY